MEPVRVWRQNYQWGLPSYMTGASLALLVAWLYLGSASPACCSGCRRSYLIYYSYDVYVVRARDRKTYGEELASFKQELAASAALHDELRTAQQKVAAEIERARRIQADLLPTRRPEVAGPRVDPRIEFLGEMGGDYFDSRVRRRPPGHGLRRRDGQGPGRGPHHGDGTVAAARRNARAARPARSCARSTRACRATSRASACRTS